MSERMRLAAVIVLLSSGMGASADRDTLKVGVQPDGRIVVPTNQILKPAGKQVTFPGRPVDLALLDKGKSLVVKNMRDLVVIDVATGAIKQTLPIPGGAVPKGGKPAGFSATGLRVLNDNVFVSDSQSTVHVAKVGEGDTLSWSKAFPVDPPAIGGPAYPTGLAWQAYYGMWVCSSRGNEIQLLDTDTGKVKAKVPVGVSPYMAVEVNHVGKDARTLVYVSNWGGDPPEKDVPLTTSGTPVQTDPRTNVANTGTISVVENLPGGWRQVKTIPVGGHPSGMVATPFGRWVYVANANSDTVSVIDTRLEEVVETIDCKTASKLPFGSGANAVALGEDDDFRPVLFVANGTNNCIAVIHLSKKSGGDAKSPDTSSVAGFIPTGWYPGAVLYDRHQLYVANVKGHGALSPKKAAPKPKDKVDDGDDPAAGDQGHNSHDHLGSVSLVKVPDAETLKKFTATVNENNRLGYSLAGLEAPRPNATPVPVPERHGEPSVFEHVVYVIKENRTYDQVFGDMKEGNGDKNLCIFGEEVTPNHHKLARDFVLLDNFYCSGVLSADGHSWTNAAYVTDYLEKQFGQFTRSYPYEGSDPLAFPTTGFLWDNALLHKKAFRNYGEFVKSSYEPKNATWTDVYQDYAKGTSKVKVTAKPNLRSLDAHSHAGYPGFPLTAPDVYRAKIFTDELKEFEKQGKFPNLIYLFLPADHTNGTRPGSPTPRAMVADNDLALGMVVEALSKSKFWPKMCILVTEDDPQNGFDHVDGHRTVGLAISPYTRKRGVDSTCYNQTGIVKTIEMMLGLPPMNQMDLSATPMRGCFNAKPDLEAYRLVQNRIPLDEMNKPLASLKGKALYYAKESAELELEEEDQAEEDIFNRILWYSVRGEEPYPGDR